MNDLLFKEEIMWLQRSCITGSNREIGIWNFSTIKFFGVLRKIRLFSRRIKWYWATSEWDWAHGVIVLPVCLHPWSVPECRAHGELSWREYHCWHEWPTM
jgi:hypothetical protein